MTDDRWFPEIAEGIRRLPEDVRAERYYRLIRAAQLGVQNSVLPKDQWTQHDDVS